MKEIMAWIAAEAEQVSGAGEEHEVLRRQMSSQSRRCEEEDVANLPAHSFPGRELSKGDTLRRRAGERGRSQNPQHAQSELHASDASVTKLSWEEARERRTYRRETIRMLRRYMRYSIETGRLPSVLGREFFRAPVSPYSCVTFEDRVIFVHDMETSLSKLDEFSREIIARHILQEHDQEATARFLRCTGRTVRTYVPIALDLLSEILLDVGLLERTFPIRENSCQGGETGNNCVSG